ncbi:hypothetical protein DLM76_14380 [Leptospira yasudae]|nr:hypothetical protein DLM76_14380 [Leptospira yasudae]
MDVGTIIRDANGFISRIKATFSCDLVRSNDSFDSDMVRNIAEKEVQKAYGKFFEDGENRRP